MATLDALGYFPTTKDGGGEVERRITSKIKRDWGHFADIIRVHPVHGWLVLQVTSDSNLSARVTKCLRQESLLACLLAPSTAVQVWGWSVRRGQNHVRRFSFGLEGDKPTAVQIGKATIAEEVRTT